MSSTVLWSCSEISRNTPRSLLTFFFSSRRRHTRCGRDWSSDVCSSDLLASARAVIGPGDEAEREIATGGAEGRVQGSGRPRKQARREADGDGGQRDDVGKQLVIQVDQAQDKESGRECHQHHGAQRRSELQGEAEIEQAVRGFDERVPEGDRGAAVPAAAEQKR